MKIEPVVLIDVGGVRVATLSFVDDVGVILVLSIVDELVVVVVVVGGGAQHKTAFA